MNETMQPETEPVVIPVTVGLKPAWGITPPTDAVAAWGARAIYSENHGAYAANHTKRGTKRKRMVIPYFGISLCWDRQGAAGDGEKLNQIQAWINAVGLKRLAKECSDRYIQPHSEDRVEFTEGIFTMHASPRASYGYLYIGVWVK